MQPKIWSCVNAKTAKNKWNFHPKKTRGQVAELSSTIKPETFGSKVYKMGPYRGTLNELKEFAKMKNFSHLTNGAIRYKVA